MRRKQRITTLRLLRVLKNEIDNAVTRAEMASKEIEHWAGVCEANKCRIEELLRHPMFRSARTRL